MGNAKMVVTETEVKTTRTVSINGKKDKSSTVNVGTYTRTVNGKTVTVSGYTYNRTRK